MTIQLIIEPPSTIAEQIGSCSVALSPTTTIVADDRPALSGTVSDSTAIVTITIDGNDYQAINNQNGTWSILEGVILQLAIGVYPVSISAICSDGSTGTGNGSVVVVAAYQLGGQDFAYGAINTAYIPGDQ